MRAKLIQPVTRRTGRNAAVTASLPSRYSFISSLSARVVDGGSFASVNSTIPRCAQTTTTMHRRASTPKLSNHEGERRISSTAARGRTNMRTRDFMSQPGEMLLRDLIRDQFDKELFQRP